MKKAWHTFGLFRLPQTSQNIQTRTHTHTHTQTRTHTRTRTCNNPLRAVLLGVDCFYKTMKSFIGSWRGGGRGSSLNFETPNSLISCNSLCACVWVLGMYLLFDLRSSEAEAFCFFFTVPSVVWVIYVTARLEVYTFCTIRYFTISLSESRCPGTISESVSSWGCFPEASRSLRRLCNMLILWNARCCKVARLHYSFDQYTHLWISSLQYTHHAIASEVLLAITLLVHFLARDVYQQRARDQGRIGACTEVSAVRIIISPRGVFWVCAFIVAISVHLCRAGNLLIMHKWSERAVPTGGTSHGTLSRHSPELTQYSYKLYKVLKQQHPPPLPPLYASGVPLDCVSWQMRFECWRF